MTREELKLNDFEGFDRYLKTLETGKKSIWGTFYNEATNIFTPPIIRPMTLAEYQLDHYALWMVIHAFKLVQKPKNWAGNETAMRCYPCIYSYKNGTYDKFPCHVCCPLVLDVEGYNYCGSAYRSWDCNNDPDAAYDVAHLEWRDI